MKRIQILSIFMAVVLFASCGKEFQDGVSLQEYRQNLTVALNLGDITKDSGYIDGIFFPDEDNSGAIMLGGDTYFTVMAVPVNSDGTLDWDACVADLPRSIRCKKDQTFSMVIYSETGMTTDEWFAGDKGYGCVFFGVIGGDYSYAHNIDYCQIVTYDSGEDYYYNYIRTEYNTRPRILYHTIGGEAKHLLPVYMGYWTETRYGKSRYSFSEYGVVPSSRADHLIAAHSKVAFHSDVANAKFLNFASFAPIGTLLRFNMKTSDGNALISRIEVSVENTGNNMCGDAFVDFSNVDFNSDEPNGYALYTAKELGLENDTYIGTYYLQDDGTTWGTTYTWTSVSGNHSANFGENMRNLWSTDYYRAQSNWYFYNEDGWVSPVTVSTAPTDWYEYFGLFPQSYSAEGAVVFKAYDTNHECISTVTKSLPVAGLQSGVRYDFTLDWGSVNKLQGGSTAAGSYEQGEEMTEE